jgi:aryl-alcohol dehydrogenase-like predicted oxidoreductase
MAPIRRRNGARCERLFMRPGRVLMAMTRQLGTTDLHVFPLCLGGNVFGWTADEAQSFAVLDAYAAAGGNFIDTADAYSAWVPGHVGGESETIIGRWMKARGNRRTMIVATKIGRLNTMAGLSAATIQAGAEASLRRLDSDYIDLYFAHTDDQNTPLDESLRAFDALVRAGKVRHVAASNYTAPRLAEALAVSRREHVAPYAAVQPHYNLAHRQDYEGALRDLCRREHLSCVPYFALASGFLTGKYRPGVTVDSPRAPWVASYQDARGQRMLEALDVIAGAHQTTVAAVALAWLLADPTIAAPIASARTPEQLAGLLPSVQLRLTDDEIARLTAVGSAS